ncbi:uncharacterized protein TNCV_4164581 [Trichonephila clavipes]|nr:uncharacterized protein TNCV_4164581 [Trichonephila clavipes]
MVSRLFLFARREFVRCYRKDRGPSEDPFGRLEIRKSSPGLYLSFLTAVMVTFLDFRKKYRMRKWLATLTTLPLVLGSNLGEDMDVCKWIVPSRHGGTLNSHRAASPLVRLVEEEKRWEAPDHPQSILPQNWGETE